MPHRSPETFSFKHFRLEHHRSSMKIGTDAVLLGAWVSQPDIGSALDVGSGCGVIAMMLAQRGAIWVDGIDTDVHSYTESAGNFHHSPWPERLHAYHVRLQDWVGLPGGYNLIVSNPPFFHHHLRSMDIRRAGARHADTLSADELSYHAYRLGAPDAHFACVFPYSLFREFGLALARAGWFLLRRQDVVTCHRKPPGLVLSEWTKTPGTIDRMDPLFLRNLDGQWHEDYRTLVSDFYPHF